HVPRGARQLHEHPQGRSPAPAHRAAEAHARCEVLPHAGPEPRDPHPARWCAGGHGHQRMMWFRASILTLLLAAAALLTWPDAVPPADAWGFVAHKRINRMACFTLPPEMFPFFKRHIDFVSDEAGGPDRRRYAVEGEAERHYIDIDHYGHGGQDPFAVMPRKWEDAVRKYSEDTLLAYGIVPWHIQVMFDRLVRAFQRGNVDHILRTATDLGHYVADAHVPLHTTENYNGQLTDQYGIHAFWESRIPELSADGYDH